MSTHSSAVTLSVACFFSGLSDTTTQGYKCIYQRCLFVSQFLSNTVAHCILSLAPLSLSPPIQTPFAVVLSRCDVGSLVSIIFLSTICSIDRASERAVVNRASYESRPFGLPSLTRTFGADAPCLGGVAPKPHYLQRTRLRATYTKTVGPTPKARRLAPTVHGPRPNSSQYRSFLGYCELQAFGCAATPDVRVQPPILRVGTTEKS